MRFIIIASVLASFLLPACGDDGGEEAFDTFQDCFDDHHEAESLSVEKSIVICCLDHPIAGATEVCGISATTCATYVSSNLEASSATSAEVMTACTDYEMQKGM